MRIISLFSGIGGLERADCDPVLLCELDPEAQGILSRRFPTSEMATNVLAVRKPPSADLVLGGWPCQDISVAGRQDGLKGKRSGLFTELLRVARASGAEMLIAENVPNLLRLRKGNEMRAVIDALHDEGFPFVSWRTLNAREFGVPHQRRRVFIVASRAAAPAMALHRQITERHLVGPAGVRSLANHGAAGFYWTGGTHSICYSIGFIPTLKVGSSISIPSPVALHLGNAMRRISPAEAFRLQGFDPQLAKDLKSSTAYRLAGNAVSRPVGEFVVDSVADELDQDLFVDSIDRVAPSGLSTEGSVVSVQHECRNLADNLAEFLDCAPSDCAIGKRAASGLIRRLVRSGKPCPEALWRLLCEESGQPSLPHPSSQIVARDARPPQLATMDVKQSVLPL